MTDFLKKLLLTLIPMMLTALRGYLTHEKFVYYGDKLLDVVERWIAKETSLDWADAFLMEIVSIIREAANIPDLPDEPTA